MQGLLIGLVVVGILVVGTLMGVTALLIAPLLGVAALMALLIWMARRRAQHRPPIE